MPWRWGTRALKKGSPPGSSPKPLFETMELVVLAHSLPRSWVAAGWVEAPGWSPSGEGPGGSLESEAQGALAHVALTWEMQG